MADRADAFAEAAVPVRQQIGTRRKRQQRNGCQRQGEDEFFRTLWHLVTSLHLQHVTRFRDHFVKHRVDKESEEQPRVLCFDFVLRHRSSLQLLSATTVNNQVHQEHYNQHPSKTHDDRCAGRKVTPNR